MQLFAILANSEFLNRQGRQIVIDYLREQLNEDHVDGFISAFDEQVELLKGKKKDGKSRKRVSVNSVKVLKICTAINEELDQIQKHIVLLRLMEFVYASGAIHNEQEKDFLRTVAEVFNIDREDYYACLSLLSLESHDMVADQSYFLRINSVEEEGLYLHSRHILNHALQGQIVMLFLASTNLIFFVYQGKESLQLNGHPLSNQKVYVLSPGSVIRGAKAHPIYYSDAVQSFLKDERPIEFTYEVEELEYIFRGGKHGLHPLSFSSGSGNLVAIMGGSGTGKSTLLNILNSNVSPGKGHVLIDGKSLHENRQEFEGLIGYIPQDDLLLEKLTVYQNLYYNAKLCLADLEQEELEKRVDLQLVQLGLSDIKHLRVGSPLDKTISGGQRKRLNVALELIRKPSILFVDEPTSGLSSLDSENVMDLMKQLAISGKLIFVVIHQPSSDIFKLFDQLLLLDVGGYPIYYGNPADSIIYFKSAASHVNAEESECIHCGNLNPEQIFSIVEAKVMTQYGQPTDIRKKNPKDWNNKFLNASKEEVSEKGLENYQKEARIELNKPGWFGQLKIFTIRDVLSKIKNTQYILINTLEAPLLAFVLAFVLKYTGIGGEYTFSHNLNLPVYLFIGVVVALFMGLTVSAEEIVRDRKILKRESFLNLSWSSYLSAKTLVQFGISAVQTLLFVLIGNSILEIKGMFLEYWLVLFSVSAFANLTGLNISSAFKSVVTIYIIIPFLIIPQIILSGVMVRFEHLHPKFAKSTTVPIVGEVMVTRWAFEALAVKQFTSNEYDKKFYAIDRRISNSMYKRDFSLIYLEDLLMKNKKEGINQIELELISNELSKEYNSSETIPGSIKNLASSFNDQIYLSVKNIIDSIRSGYKQEYKNLTKTKNNIVLKIVEKYGKDGIGVLEGENHNQTLKDLLLGANSSRVYYADNEKLIRFFRPIYMDGREGSFVKAPMYVAGKNIFGRIFSTYWVNLFVMWFSTIFLAIALYFKLLEKTLFLFERKFRK